jgi:hypothetical protein
MFVRVWAHTEKKHPFMNEALSQGWLKKMLSSRSASIGCMLLAIGAKTGLINIFFTFNRDMLLQSLAAKNLVEGSGLTLTQVHASDLSTVVHEPIAGWPPLYSGLVSIFYILFNKNLVAACMTVAIISFVAFLWLLRKLLVLLGFPAYLVNILILFNGFNITDYLQRSLPTDMPALLCCLWSCYMAMVFVNNLPAGQAGKNKPVQYGWLLGVVNSLSSLLRYMYLGIAPVVPAILIWNGWNKKDKRLLRGGMYSLAATVIITGGMLLFQQFYTGSSTYTRPAEQGFFFSNLQYTQPFVLSSLANLDFVNMQLSLHSGISYAGWTRIETILGFFLLLLLLFVFIRYCFKTKMIATTPLSLFFIAGGLISFSVWLLLMYVSVRNSAHYVSIPEFDWVYISEARYFAVVLIVLQVFFAWWLFMRAAGKMIWVLRLLFLLLIGIEIAHNTYFIAKYLIKNEPQVALLTDDKTKSVITRVIADCRRRNIEPVFTSNSQVFCGEAFLAGAHVMYNVEEVNNAVIKASRPTLLVLFVDMNDSRYFKTFFERKNINKISQEGNFCFFTYYIEPGGHQ